MGNQQSNERKRNWKICKITQVDEHSGWIRCYLDNYVPYSNGERRYMDFATDAALNFIEGAGFLFGVTPPDVQTQAYLSEGEYIAIDTNMTRGHESSQNFSRRSVINVSVGNSSGLAGEGGFQGLVGDISERRERHARANEWANFDKQMQQAWQLQPPKK